MKIGVIKIIKIIIDIFLGISRKIYLIYVFGNTLYVVMTKAKQKLILFHDNNNISLLFLNSGLNDDCEYF
jgi:hypothetical protein